MHQAALDSCATHQASNGAEVRYKTIQPVQIQVLNQDLTDWARLKWAATMRIDGARSRA